MPLLLLGRWNPLPYAYNVWRLSFYPLKGIWSPLVRSYKVDDSLYYPMKGNVIASCTGFFIGIEFIDPVLSQEET